MARVTEKPLAVVGAALALCTFGIASAQEVALATSTPDSKFLTDAIRGDLAEVKLGELAKMKGQSEGVRDFGDMLADDHSKAMKKTADLAKEMNVTPPTQPTPEQTQKYDTLARLSGAEFDRQFAAEMVKGHQQEIAKYEAQAKGDSKVADLAGDMVPTLKHHLETAQKLQSGGAAARHDDPDHDGEVHGPARRDRPNTVASRGVTARAPPCPPPRGT
jgi:putative membrane protein